MLTTQTMQVNAPLIRSVAQHRALPSPAGAQLSVRLATSASDVIEAQRLRHAVFFEHEAGEGRRDVDAFDPFCDHLLVCDRAASNRVVGTYRLMTAASAAFGPGFYAAQAFDLAPFLAVTSGECHLELGRACVLPAYRTRRTIELLWRGIWAYVRSHSVSLMFGSASLPGIGTAEVVAQRQFLAQFAGLSAGDDVFARPDRTAGPLPGGAAPSRHVFPSLPPLVKAYCRLGARFSTSAAEDHDMQCTDVFVMLRVADIEARYISYFSEPANAAIPSR